MIAAFTSAMTALLRGRGEELRPHGLPESAARGALVRPRRSSDFAPSSGGQGAGRGGRRGWGACVQCSRSAWGALRTPSRVICVLFASTTYVLGLGLIRCVSGCLDHRQQERWTRLFQRVGRVGWNKASGDHSHAHTAARNHLETFEGSAT